MDDWLDFNDFTDWTGSDYGDWTNYDTGSTFSDALGGNFDFFAPDINEALYNADIAGDVNAEYNADTGMWDDPNSVEDTPMTMDDYLSQLSGVLPAGVLSALKSNFANGGLAGKTIADVLKGSSGSWFDKLVNMGRMAGETAAAIPQRYSSTGKLWDTYYPQTKQKADSLLSLAGTVPELAGMLMPTMNEAQGQINTAGSKAMNDLNQFSGNLMNSALHAGNDQMDIFQAMGVSPNSGMANRTMATTLNDKFAQPMLAAGTSLLGKTQEASDALWGQLPTMQEKYQLATPTTKGSILAQVPNMEQKLGYQTTMEPDQWGLAGAGLKFASTMPDFFKSMFSGSGGTT